MSRTPVPARRLTERRKKQCCCARRRLGEEESDVRVRPTLYVHPLAYTFPFHIFVASTCGSRSCLPQYPQIPGRSLLNWVWQRHQITGHPSKRDSPSGGDKDPAMTGGGLIKGDRDL